MKYKCINEFYIEIYDERWMPTEKYETIPSGTVWELDESTNNIGGEVHLDNDDMGWIEISRNMLEECFEEVRMSDDLISRKALLEELREIMDEPHNTIFLMGIGAAISFIEHAEIAFDKEKVINDLLSNSICSSPDEDSFVELEEAIEIVEKGGIE